METARGNDITNMAAISKVRGNGSWHPAFLNGYVDRAPRPVIIRNDNEISGHSPRAFAWGSNALWLKIIL